MPKERKFLEEANTIGKNIKSIKEIFNLTWAEYANLVGISASKLTKADSGFVDFSDDELFKIQQYTNIPYKIIKSLDNEKFVEVVTSTIKNDTFDGEKTLLEVLLDDERLNLINRLYRTVFPLESDEQSLKSDSFAKAYKLASEMPFLTKVDLCDILTLFMDSLDEGASDVVFVNLQSCFLLYYSATVDELKIGDFINEKPHNLPDLLDTVKKRNALKVMEIREKKKEFFGKYGNCLDRYYEVTLDSEYKDFAEYFIWLRYANDAFPEDVIDKNPKEYFDKKAHLFENLLVTRNKYALALFNFDYK